MLTRKSLFLLVNHYGTGRNGERRYDDAIDMASNEFDNIVDETREYPPFLYYLILENMDSNPKYIDRLKWSRMSIEEKRNAFDDTIEELRKLKP